MSYLNSYQKGVVFYQKHKLFYTTGTSSGFLGVLNNTVAACGGGILAYGAIMGACIVGGIFESVLGAFLKPLRKFFPPIVTGSVVIAIGLSLLGVGINYF